MIEQQQPPIAPAQEFPPTKARSEPPGAGREPARQRTLARRISTIIAVTLVAFLSLYAGITTIIEGRRFDAAVEKDLLLLDAVVTAARGRLSDAFQLGDGTFLREQLSGLAGEIPGVVVARAYDTDGRLLASLKPLLPGDSLLRLQPGAPPRAVSTLGDELVAWLARPVYLRSALGAGEGPLLGHLVLGTSQTKNTEARWTSTAVLIVVGALTLGAMVLSVQLVISRALLRPVRAFSDGSRRIARGDLTQRFAEHDADEIGTLGRAMNAMIADLATMIRSVRAGAGEVDGAADQIVESARVVLADSRSQQELLHSAEEAAQSVGRLLRDAIDSIQSLLAMSEGVSISTAELQLAIREIGRAAEYLAESVARVEGAAEEEVEAIHQVNVAVSQLGAFVSETADLARHMDETLRNVESTVRKSLDLSLSVTERAARGREAVERSKVGMDEIRSAFNVTGEGIERLRGHSVQIGEVVRVIDGVTKQVNLLALNASIIASKSGEHGQSFGVVATEIGDLAERTSVSASQIAGLVERFQHDLAFCVASMRQGREAVENGEALAEEALGVLSGILTSSQESASIVKAITDATLRHVDEGKRIVELMAEVRERVHRIGRLTSHQTEESHRILDAAQRMGTTTRDVKRASGAQSRGGQLITQTMDRAREIVREATAIAGEQERVMARLGEVMRVFQELTSRNLRRAETMSTSVQELHGAAGVLTKEVQKFTL